MKAISSKRQSDWAIKLTFIGESRRGRCLLTKLAGPVPENRAPTGLVGGGGQRSKAAGINGPKTSRRLD